MEKPTKSARLEVRADPSWLKRIDEWRRQQEDLPTRAEAVRRMTEVVLSQPA